MKEIEANKDYSNVNYRNFLINSERYFEALNEKDSKYLEYLYHPNVELHDWDGSYFDAPVVLQFNEELFNKDLEFELLFSTQIGRITYNHILIHTGEETLKVLDVIYWDDDFKITKIEAYKG